VPINITRQKAQELATIFGCAVASMPFTYLGLPMGTTKPAMTDLLPLVDRIERRVSTTTLVMSHAGKLTYVNAILTSIATYAMCTIEINPKIMGHIEKIRRRVVWSKKKWMMVRNVFHLLLGTWYVNQKKKEVWVSSI
jgi:hypothetical protein